MDLHELAMQQGLPEGKSKASSACYQLRWVITLMEIVQWNWFGVSFNSITIWCHQTWQAGTSIPINAGETYLNFPIGLCLELGDTPKNRPWKNGKTMKQKCGHQLHWALSFWGTSFWENPSYGGQRLMKPPRWTPSQKKIQHLGVKRY